MKELNLVLRTEYKRSRQNKLAGFGDRLLEKSVGPLFEPFRSILETLTTLNEAFRQKLAAQKDTGKPGTQAKDMAKKALINQIDIYANAIDSAAISNPAIILLSGFNPRTHNTKVEPETAIESAYGLSFVGNPRVPGQGTLTFNVYNVRGYYRYEGFWTTDGITWHDGAVSNKELELVFTNLPSDTKVWVRVKIIGKTMQSAYAVSEKAYIT